MIAVELTGMDPSPSASDTSGPFPVEIIVFWPITLKRQILKYVYVSSYPARIPASNSPGAS